MKKKNIENFTNELTEIIINTIQAHLDKNPLDTISLGIDNARAEGEIFKITKHINLSNQIYEAWLILFPKKKIGIDSFKVMTALMAISSSSLPSEIRLRHIKENNLVELPKGFNLEKLVNAVEYSKEAEAAFDQIESLFDSWVSTRLKNHTIESLWNDKANKLELSETIKADIYKRAEVPAESKDVRLALGLAQITIGLANVGTLLDEHAYTQEDLYHGDDVTIQSQWVKGLIKIVSRKLTSDSTSSNPRGRDISINWDTVLHGRFDRVYQSLDVTRIRFATPEESEARKK